MLALTAVDVHPPLYYVALKLWMNLVGGDVPLMRLLGCLFLGACIAAMAVVAEAHVRNTRDDAVPACSNRWCFRVAFRL